MTKTRTPKLVSIICSLAFAAALGADERPNIIVIRRFTHGFFQPCGIVWGLRPVRVTARIRAFYM